MTIFFLLKVEEKKHQIQFMNDYTFTCEQVLGKNKTRNFPSTRHSHSLATSLKIEFVLFIFIFRLSWVGLEHIPQ